MPHFDVVRQITATSSFRTEKILSMYDLDLDKYTERFAGDLNPPEQWNVGLIVGRSATGKTTIARELFGVYEDFAFGPRSIVDEMPESATVEDIAKMFTLVGFSSIPSFLKPYAVLSQGEQMRVRLAKAFLSGEKRIVFDEFTSVVDRDVARIVSTVVAKAARHLDIQFIAVSCHYDVEEWLTPDWVFSTDEMQQRVGEKKNAQTCVCAYIDATREVGGVSNAITI